MANKIKTIGIIAGSGPEAGIDLWSKILSHTQNQLGDAFRGDLDAPRVVIISEPQLGLSMDLRANQADTWAALEKTIRQLAPQVDYFAIACNTLNWFAPQIDTLLTTIKDGGTFVSFVDVLSETLINAGRTRFGLMAAAPVLALDNHSAYTPLAQNFDVETPSDHQAMQDLIYDVKRYGSDTPALSQRMADFASQMESDTLVLACTELPLISQKITGKTLIDVTDAVAQKLARLALE